MLEEHRGRVQVVEGEVAVGDRVDGVAQLGFRRVDAEGRAGHRTGAERALRSGLVCGREPRPVALEHLDPGEQVMPQGDRLPALEMRVAGHQRVRLGLCERQDDQGERVDRLPGALACVDDIETHRCGDLIVARATCVDLLPDRPEEPLDRRMDVLVGREDRVRLVGDRRQPLLYLAQLVRREQPRSVQPRCMLGRGRAVVGKQLEIVDAQQLPHGGIELALGAA